MKSEAVCYKVNFGDRVMFSEADRACRELVRGNGVGGGSRLYEPRDFRSYWNLLLRLRREMPEVERYWVGILDVKSEEGGE